MSSAYAPRIAGVAIGSVDVTNDTETLIGTVTVLSTTDVTERLTVHVGVGAIGGTDTTDVDVKIYLGPFALGNLIGQANYSGAQYEGANNWVSADALNDLGPGVQAEQIDVTITFTGASAAGGTSGGVLLATIF